MKIGRKNYLALLLAVSTGSCSAMHVPQPAPDAFIAAAKDGNLEAVKSALARGIPVDVRDAEGMTALHYAATGGGYCCGGRGRHDDVVKELLAAGATVDARSPQGWTPLMMAATAGRAEIVKRLIVANADVNAFDEEGYDSLYDAAAWGYIDVIRQLIAAGAEPKKSLALLVAANQSNDELVKLLIDKGANVHAVDDEGKTPLHNAVRPPNSKVVKVLIDAGADVNAKDGNGVSVLQEALKAAKLPHYQGNIEVVKQLILAGADSSDLETDPLIQQAWKELTEKRKLV